MSSKQTESNNKAVGNMNTLYEESLKPLIAQVKEARKAADSLLMQIRERKEQIHAARLAEEAALREQEARAAAEEAARQAAEEAARQAAEEAAAKAVEPPVVEEAPVAEEVLSPVVEAEPVVEETLIVEETPAVEEAPVVEEPVAEVAPVVAPVEEKKPTIFIPADSPIKSKEDVEKERLAAYRAQNVQEPRKFVPPAQKPRTNAPRPDAPRGREGTPRPNQDRQGGQGGRQQPAAGTTFVPPGGGRKDSRGQKKDYNPNREYEEKRNKGRGRREVEEASEAEINRRFKQRNKSKQQEQAVVQRIEHAVVNVDPVPIKLLAEKIGRPATEIVKKLLMLGEMNTVNDSISFEMAEMLADDFGVLLELARAETLEEKLNSYLEQTQQDDSGHMVKRAPVVTIMGHVDHGKTSLLDYIRKTSVAKGEAGGITQHIGAYTIRLHDEKITFIDTPGHEAFTSMRARGAQVTDIAVIVVAADDSIMPQTVESINHAKAAGVPIIIAVNKIDKPAANIDKVKNDLTKYDLLIEEWGGDTICVPVSAKTGQGVEELLEQILLVAEVNELKANPDAPARGTIIEARLDKNLGSLATVLVQNGTLKVGDYVVAGSVMGRIKKMIDDKGNTITKAGPSVPVSVLGFTEVPHAGDQAVSVEEKFARNIAEERKEKERLERLNRSSNNLENLFKEMTEGKLKELNLIVKADVQGSVEAVCQELKKLTNEEVKVNIIHSGVGAVSESDVVLAMTSSAIIIAFNVRPDSNAKTVAAREKVDIRAYRVIYDAIDEITLALKGMLAPKFREVLLGHASVRETFHISSVGTIAGCYVTDGKITRNAEVRLLRDNVVITQGKISSLRRMKDDVKEVVSGFECGVGLEKYNDIKIGDVFECFVMEQVEV